MDGQKEENKPGFDFKNIARKKRSASLKFASSKWKQIAAEESAFSTKYSFKVKGNVQEKEERNVPRYCPYCNECFGRDCHLERHFREKHATKKPYHCDHCRVGFMKKSAFIRHKRRSSRNDISTSCRESYAKSCPICNDAFIGLKKFEQHALNQHPNLKLISCRFCDETFRRVSERNAHQKTLHLKGRKCAFCKRIFSNEQHLRMHEINGQCSNLYMKKYGGENKMANLKDVEGGPFLPTHCDICDVRFQFHYHLMQHYGEYHPKKKIFLCGTHGTGYTTKGNYDFHVRKYHNGDYTESRKKHLKYRLYTCVYCEETIAGNGNYQRHGAEKHPGCKLYFCKICPQGFTKKTGLTRHLLDIHAEADFLCESCGKSYGRQDLFLQHRKSCGMMRMKRAFGKYECGLCGRKYKQKHTYTKHVKLHDLYDFCHLCEEGKCRKDDPEGLAEHMRRRHAVKANVEALVEMAIRGRAEEEKFAQIGQTSKTERREILTLWGTTRVSTSVPPGIPSLKVKNEANM